MATRGALIPESHFYVSPRPPTPTPGPNVFLRLNPAAPSSLLVPFWETSLTLTLQGWSHPRQRGSFLGPSSPPPCPPHPQPHRREHLPSSQQIQTQTHPSNRLGVSPDAGLLCSKFMKSSSINKHIILGMKVLGASTKLAVCFCFVLSFKSAVATRTEAPGSILGPNHKAFLQPDWAGLRGQGQLARAKGSKANIVAAETTVQRLQVSGVKTKPRGSESRNF